MHTVTRPVLALLAACTLLGAPVLAAGSPQASAQAEAPPSERPLELLRQRWEQKSPAEKELLRERFRRLKRLPAEERELFVERGRRLAEQRRHFHAEGREDFEGELHRRARAEGRRFREHLPPPLLEELERTEVERRPVLLERYLRRLRHTRCRPLLERLDRELSLDERERRLLERLGEPQRLERMLELRERLRERRDEGQRPERPGNARDV